ncbi:carcinoembryonic antigen-related cell adhesion molecule 20-like [Notolabrus celidotus]|uniref:carcinoembryonic antigen-related cell adhesion molecule 20-like n=1 Tax=Notolabrus celidotus TaxID=1203425 RepID=UPI00148FD1BD|nr:carcinoembryonic antigen-related cell adhesion molecule 20-like [Notolabrus celidotus]
MKISVEDMTPDWRSPLFVLLVALMGAPCSQAWLQITWTGDITAGFSTTLTCSSSCLQNCNYTWSLKGQNVIGNTLTWTPDGVESTVEIRCTVFNPETSVSTSTTTIADVNNPLFVQIRPPNTVLPLNKSLDLVCRDATSGDLSGPSNWMNQVVSWYKDGQRVTLSENIQLLQNNLTLHFNSLLPSDAGFYQCEMSAEQLRVISLGYLLNFDPWNISISGPDTVFPGRLSKFTCLTSCTINVDCTVKWQFRGGFPLGTYLSMNGNELSWTPSIPGTFQNITCVAENAAAGRSAEATKMVEVTGVPVSGSELVQLNGLFAVILSLGLLILVES